MRKFLKPTKVSMLLAILLAGALAFTGCDSGGGGGQSEAFTPGVFTGTARGYLRSFVADEDGYFPQRDYTVWVQVDHFRIVDIWHDSTQGAATSATAHHTNNMGLHAVAAMRDRIIRHQTADVDTVTGNTVSAEGFLEGVREALTEAQAPRRFFQPTTRSRRTTPIDVDVLVVGSGWAGSTAALSLALANPDVNVMLIEKQEVPGGVTAFSAAVVTFAQTDSQADGRLWGDYLENIAQGWVDREMVDRWTDNAWTAARHILPGGVVPVGNLHTGSQSVPRMRFFPDTPQNPRVSTGFFQRAQNAGVVTWLGVRATELLTNNAGHVIGARAECADTGHTWTFNTRAGVILATGGFDNCPILMAENNRDTRFDPNHGIPSTGDGIHMGRAIGADTVFKGGVGGFSVPGPGWPGLLSTFLGRSWGLVSEDGRSFFEEFGSPVDDLDSPYPGFTQVRSYGPNEYNYAGHRTPANFNPEVFHERDRGDYAFLHRWMVDVRWQNARLPENNVTFMGQPSYRPDFSFWILSRAANHTAGDQNAISRGHMFYADTIEDLAAEIGMDALVTVDVNGTPTEMTLLESAWRKTNVSYTPGGNMFRALRNQPASLISFGGLKLDTNARVLAADNNLSPIPAGQPIPGLWASGDTATGQVLYLMYPGSGTALSFAMTFSYLAARDALARLAALGN